MTAAVQSHKTETRLVKSPPAKVDAGADMTLQITVTCPQACDLRGKLIELHAQNGTKISEMALASFQDKTNDTGEFRVKAPTKIGENAWSVVFPANQTGEVLHEESSAPLRFEVKPHMTSMAVWDFPTPATTGTRFKVKVGATCSAECSLKGKQVEVYDEKGKKVATGKLGGTSWPRTTGLYWKELTLAAPTKEGVFSRKVRFPASGLKLPHEGSSYDFYFRSARPGVHTVTVEVTAKDTKAPIRSATILLHPYEGSTDEDGIANVSVAKGKYELDVSGQGYSAFQESLEVTDDVTIKVELLPAPPQY